MSAPPLTRPRLGFAGVGWIGRNRLEALEASGLVEVAAVADPELDDALDSLDELLERDLDGVVIATPSALHAEQAVTALERGLAVFCQKPPARNAGETRRVLAAARAADRLLAIDLSYRHVEALRAAHEQVASGAIGDVHTIDLVFHNAYGPDKPWFTDPELAGGGCLIDLGTHLVDLALWLTETARSSDRHPVVPNGRDRSERNHGIDVEAARTLSLHGHAVEDFATAELALADVRARVACSWFSSAGQDCVFECTAWGSEGAVSVSNVNGSFYDFRAELWRGTSADTVVEPRDAWGGRAIADWAERLRGDRSYDPAADQLELVAETIDAIYAKAGRGR
jgi:predicted dehydrogenase